MKRTKRLKKMITLAGIVTFSFAALLSPATTIIVEASAPTTVSPCADIIEWRYKIENGKLYKRLFNYTTALWVGDWIYVCEYPAE